jgi:hypothetical protein
MKSADSKRELESEMCFGLNIAIMLPPLCVSAPFGIMLSPLCVSDHPLPSPPKFTVLPTPANLSKLQLRPQLINIPDLPSARSELKLLSECLSRWWNADERDKTN